MTIFKKNMLHTIIAAILGISRYEFSDLRIPEFCIGEMLCTPNGEACIILEVDPAGRIGVEYTILWKEEIYSNVSEQSLTSWKVLSETDQNPFMLSM